MSGEEDELVEEKQTHENDGDDGDINRDDDGDANRDGDDGDTNRDPDVDADRAGDDEDGGGDDDGEADREAGGSGKKSRRLMKMVDVEVEVSEDEEVSADEDIANEEDDGDGFVDDREVALAGKKRRKKKRRKHDKLDEDDYAVIEENTGRRILRLDEDVSADEDDNQQRKRLKKKRLESEQLLISDAPVELEVKEEADDDDKDLEQNYLDEQDERNFNEHAKALDNAERLKDIFGDMNQFFQENSKFGEEVGLDQQESGDEGKAQGPEESSEEEQQVDEPAGDRERKRFYKLKPTQKIVYIQKTDIPERLIERQIQLQSQVDSEKEAMLEEEARWIFDTAFKNHKQHRENEAIIPVIIQILAYLRLEKLEVPYIALYKKEYWRSPSRPMESLTQDDLWLIDEWDGKFSAFYNRRRKLTKLVDKLAPGDTELVAVIKHASTDLELDDVQDYLNEMAALKKIKRFGASQEIDDEVAGIENGGLPKRKRPVKLGTRFLRLQAIDGLEEVAKMIGLTPRQFGENLQNNFLKHEPEVPDKELEEEATRCLCERLDSLETVLKAARSLAARALSLDVLVRSAVRQLFLTKALISTQPTVKGAREITWTHEFYQVKRLVQKPVSQFQGTYQFLILDKAVREGYIKMEIHLEGPPIVILKEEEGTQPPAKPDPLFALLAELYCPNTGYTAKARRFHEERVKILNEAVAQYLYKIGRDYVVSTLIQSSREVVVDASCQRLRHMATQGRPGLEEKNFKLVSIVVGEPDVSTAIVLLNDYGDVIDHLSLHFLKQRANAKDNDPGSRTLYERKKEDIRRFQEWLSIYDPHLIIIDTNSLDSIEFQKDLVAKALYDRPMLKVHFADSCTGKIFASSERAAAEFKEYSPGLRQAISMGRYILDPLSELAAMWHLDEDSVKNNLPFNKEIMSLSLHPWQKEVPPEMMLASLEKTFMKLVNHVGVDINAVVSRPFMEGPVPFICGLGQVKAKQLLDHVRRKGFLSSREELTTEPRPGEPRVFGEIVYRNMAGFIMVMRNYAMEEAPEAVVLNFLDQTRIHPESYSLAQSVVLSALEVSDDEEEEASAAERQKKIMGHVDTLRDPNNLDKIDQLDLDRFALDEEESGRGKQLDTLNLIKSEFKGPFADRDSVLRPYDEPSHDELFELMSGESKTSLRRGQVVEATVVMISGKGAVVKLDSGLRGWIDARNVSDNPVHEDHHGGGSNIKLEWLLGRLAVGMTVVCRVIRISKKDCKVELSCRSSDLTKEKDLEWEKKEYENFDKYLHVGPHEDDEKLLVDKRKEVSEYIPRSIVHPNFKNVSRKEAEEFLAGDDKHQGDVVVRPSPKGVNHLTITWKVYEGVYFHIDVAEEDKPPSSMLALGRTLKIGKETFEDLDEILHRFIDPMCKYSTMMINEPYFRFADESEILLMLSQEKAVKRVPYFVSCMTNQPGIFVFRYLPNNSMRHEYITVTPQGFQFRDRIETEPRRLIEVIKRFITKHSRGDADHGRHGHGDRDSHRNRSDRHPKVKVEKIEHKRERPSHGHGYGHSSSHRR